MADDEAPWQLDEPLRPPPEVTRDVFLAWQQVRPGRDNPERMTNPVWAWLARQPEVSAYLANRHFGVERGDRPGWTNQRFGQSTTALPDGRTIAVAGEHEDYYDPDFNIYNDVIVTAPDGGVEIYGYPRAVFPATDFHSATLVGDHLYLVGNLGYRDARQDRTQVLRLDLGTLAIERLEAGGESPGWISRHEARLDDGDRITVTGGRCEVELDGGRTLRDSVDDHVLDLRSLTWTRTTDRRWTQYAIERSDEGFGRLWDIGQLADYVDRDDAWSQQQAASYRERIGYEPDLAAWRSRYQPPVAHQPLPADREAWRVHRIAVDGVTVRYVDSGRGVQVVIEGPLPAATVGTLSDDLRAKLSRADRGPRTARCLGDPR